MSSPLICLVMRCTGYAAVARSIEAKARNGEYTPGRIFRCVTSAGASYCLTMTKGVDMEDIDFPCAICSTPAKVDRINGLCQACKRRTCTSCARRCGRCGRTFCENDVEERKVMIQQAEHHMLLCELCRLILLL